METNLDYQPLETNNIIIVGLSGSGKDTIMNYIKNTNEIYPIRFAGTIKQIIMEKQGVTFEELEQLKREHQEFREMHHIESDYMGSEGHQNRVKQIRDGVAFDMQYKTKYQQTVIFDGRNLELEIKHFVDKPNWYFIFLSRLPNDNEVARSDHFTEVRMFKNNELSNFIEKHKIHARSIIIINNKTKVEPDEKDLEVFENSIGYYNISGENATQDNLEQIVQNLIDSEII